MKNFDVIITPKAVIDISGIYTYISCKLLAKSAADNLVKKFKHVISDIRNFPDMYPLHRNEKLAVNGIRIAPVANYSIFYCYYDNTIYVLRVMYGRVSLEDVYIPYPQDLSIVCEEQTQYNK